MFLVTADDNRGTAANGTSQHFQVIRISDGVVWNGRAFNKLHEVFEIVKDRIPRQGNTLKIRVKFWPREDISVFAKQVVSDDELKLLGASTG